MSRQCCVKGKMKLSLLQMKIVFQVLACQYILIIFMMATWQKWQKISQTLTRMNILFIQRLMKLSMILIISRLLTVFHLISRMMKIMIAHILQVNQNLTSMRHFRRFMNRGKPPKDMLT